MERPQTGIGILIVRDDEILMGKRRGSHGEGEYAFPGGHLELGETVTDSVRRELDEEIGPDLKIGAIGFLCLTNMRIYAPKHYTDIGVTAEWISGEPQVMEPHKIESWDWHKTDKLPQPLFGATLNYIDAYTNGTRFFEDLEPQCVWTPSTRCLS